MGGGLPLCRGAVSVFYSPRCLSKKIIFKSNMKDPFVGLKQYLIRFYPTFQSTAGCNTRSFLSGLKLIWIQSFHSPRLAANQMLDRPPLSWYLHKTNGRTNGFIHFQRALAQSEMPSSCLVDIGLPIPFPTTITVALSMPLINEYIYWTCILLI